MDKRSFERYHPRPL